MLSQSVQAMSEVKIIWKEKEKKHKRLIHAKLRGMMRVFGQWDYWLQVRLVISVYVK